MEKRRFLLACFVNYWLCLPVCADHLPPVDPIRLHEDHSHENHAGHREFSWNPQGSNLSYTNFTDAMVEVGLREVNLTEAVFDRAWIAGSAAGATFQNSSFRETNWVGAEIGNTMVSATDFTGSNLSDSNFYDATFSGVIMQDVDLSLAFFRNVSLNDTIMRGVNLSGAYLREVDLRSVVVDETTTYDRFTKFPEDFDPIAAGMTETPTQHGIKIRGVIGGFVVPDYLSGVAFEPSSGNLLMIKDTSFVFRYSTQGELLGVTEVPFSPVGGIDVLPNGDWLLASPAEERLGIYSVDSNEVLSNVFLEYGEFEGIAYDSKRGTVFITEDDGFLKEVGLDGGLIDCCFGTAEHENLGYDAQRNLLIALRHRLDFLSERGDVVDSIPLHEEGLLGKARSISLDQVNRLLYALYPNFEQSSTTVRIFDLTLIPEPLSAFLWVLAFVAFLLVGRESQGT